MGFEVDNKKKDVDLWDLKKEATPSSEKIISKSFAEALSPQKTAAPGTNTPPVPNMLPFVKASYNTKTPSKTTVSSAARTSPGAKNTAKAKQTAVIIVAILAIGIALLGRAFSARQQQVEHKPIAITTRLAFLGNTVPVPEGMEYDSYDWVEPTLTIYLKGDAETSDSDYFTSRVFALRLIEEANEVIFVEEDTGKVYAYQR